MTAIISLWPRRFRNQGVEIVRSELTETHRIERTSDGMLTISLDELLLSELLEIPEFIERTRDQRASIALNLHGMRVLKRFLNEMTDI